MALNTSSNLPPTPTYRPFPSEAAQQALNRTLAELTPSYPEHQHNSIHLAPVFVGSLSDLQSLQEPPPTISSNATLTPTFQQIMPDLNRGFAPTTLQTPRQLIESIPHTINPTDSFPKFVSPQEVLFSNNPSMVLTNPHLPLALNDAVQQMTPQAHHLQLESVPQTPPNEVNLPDLEIWYITPEFFDTLCGVDVLDCALYGTGILYAVAVTAEVGDSWRCGEFDNVEVKGKEVFLGCPSIEFSIGGQTSYPSPITARSGSIPIAAGPVEDVLTPSPARAENNRPARRIAALPTREPPLLSPGDQNKPLLSRRMEFAAQIRQVSGIDLSRFIAFTNLDEQEQETAIANVLAEFPDKNAKWAKKELCRVLKTYNSGKKKMEGNFLRYGTKMKPKGV